MDQHSLAPAGDPDRVTIRPHGLQGILATVPYLLGFHPRQSLVPVLVDENRVILTLRLDIDHLVDDTYRTKEFLGEQLERTGASALLLVAYTDRPDAAVGEALASLSLSLEAEQLVHTDAPHVIDAVHVAGDRYRSVTCGDTNCCPEEGRDYAAVLSDEAAAEAVLNGLPALSDREAMRAWILPGSEDAGEGFEEHLMDSLRWLCDCDPREAAQEMDRLLRRVERTGGDVSTEELAELVGLATHPSARDVATLRIDRFSSPLWGEVWSMAARCADGLAAVGPLGLVGLAAWARGDGALVCLCLEEGEQILPEHGLVRLLDDVVGFGLHPDEWHRMRQESLDEYGPLGPAAQHGWEAGDEQAVG